MLQPVRIKNNNNINTKIYDGLDLEEVGVSEGGGEAEDEVSLRVLRDRLQDGAVHNYQMLRGRLHRAALKYINVKYAACPVADGGQSHQPSAHVGQARGPCCHLGCMTTEG